ncbi:RecQ family ATP-dependent DNA helicase [Actimicrobium sp. CCI2.3]|uniref:RecQ family ATP-dependent DNA helicase n=1 Tax=Actimicrobium sp. CCI2.3 TaxID=3048616 RepID=UPI002AB3BC1E|nr:RecQ family ATP-dependent DNA helicase [Actimicrobium sp. CCI2.3]MDY7576578.1 RecQ family ATP-dependent DNA helicase [Actimicrobium sp. CCI2.3]MEB0021179.1 RecQ family ATP-dependent DNA helicase [Actimicrobium sp. CCI2.3]
MKLPLPENLAPVVMAPRCLSIDLEVGIQDCRIHSFAAVQGDTRTAFVFRKGDLSEALSKLDDFAASSSFLLGHNLIGFDLPHLAAAAPTLALLHLPAVDTLRLNPLAFPRNPYHHLVKHYQDGRLQSGSLNDPELDARLALTVFHDQLLAFQTLQSDTPDLLTAWHWLTVPDGISSGLNAVFMTIRRAARPSSESAHAAILRRLSGQACRVQGQAILNDSARHGWALAYALSWLSVAGGNSVMPPWVRHQFPAAGELVRQLRDVRCDDPSCDWCSERHDALKELQRWFGLPGFRPEPVDADGRPLQQAIVEAAMTGRHALAILPTGTGKSLCYQLPALSRYDKTGALTIVISPLVALMADQVAGLEARGIACCAAINGMLSMPERADVLDRVRLGDIGILIVSPEQLRNRALRTVLAQREIGAWVLDEAHCLSKWGHDFRPDYRYVGRFIRESAGAGNVPPVLCLTATAKPDVVADMVGYFRDKVGIALAVFNGGAERKNLDFVVVPTTPATKFADIFQLVMTDLPLPGLGGAIVYCALRKQTEEVAQFLREKGVRASHFHAGLAPEVKKVTQQRFIAGKLTVMVATNAFGMGIDKPDVRLVIHADIPGSLENYLQEAGRAGRDRAAARCVLLYTPEDVERQFGMSARSRLTQREIQSILKALKNINRKKRLDGEIIATAGEILAEDNEAAFQRDSATDDTRVRTGIAWLEEAALLTREENRVQVFPSSLRVASLDEARQKLAGQSLFADYQRQLLALVQALISADADEGISTDELMGVSGLSADKVRAALYDLETLGIASNDTALTAFVHVGVERSSLKRLAEAAELEIALIDLLRQAAPELGKGDDTLLQLRHATQALKDAGHTTALPEKLARIVRSLASDGRNEDGGTGSLRLRRLDAESLHITLQRDWSALAKTAALRRSAASVLLAHLLASVPTGLRGADLLAVTTLGKLHAAMDDDLTLKMDVKEPAKLLDRALLWLHEQEVIRLNKGLAVFRPAMTIRLAMDKRGFAKADFAPLKLHYDEQVVQIHVMAEYVQRGLQAIAQAVQLAMDYFSLERDEFMQRWLPDREKELARQTTPASWRSIVEELNNPVQQKIVTDDREQTNVLVLAGPGSGKTRVLVHRIAYLIRVKRENPRAILALAYNRHAAVEVRRRLAALIGDDARGVVVLTCHAFAMRLTGASFRGRSMHDGEAFREVMRQAVALLKGDGLPADEADQQRDQLLAAFRWILVDEYQDIGPDQYYLISALAGRTRSEEDGRLSLFAVGDDDQNIYAFDGASVEFIRRFEQDYAARPAFLLDNYRSTRHIIAAANALVAPARERMKADNPVTIDSARSKADGGGDWAVRDPVGKGRVQILPAGESPVDQAVAVMTELQRLCALDPDWDWSRVAVIARDWYFLDPVRCYCERAAIPVQLANEEIASFWRLRETRALIDWLHARESALIDTGAVYGWLATQPSGPWWALLREAIDDYRLETVGAELPAGYLIDWLAEWGREMRRRQTGLLLLTAHRAKGLEFDHVAILDGHWDRRGGNEDADAPRRLYYVAMTRARHTLLLARSGKRHVLIDALPESPALLRRQPAMLSASPPELARRYLSLTPQDVYIGFAGRHQLADPVHAAIAALSAGDPITLIRGERHWELNDCMGRTIGRLSKAFTPPAGMRFVSARVAAVLVWYRDEADPGYQALARCEQWEVVLPELVFGPMS